MKTIPQIGALPKVRRFLQKPLREKSKSVYLQFTRISDLIPFPIRLPFGAWWIWRNDALSRMLRHEGFESAEISFVQRFLKPGMTVLDIGAHHGFYTLLASGLVGSTGRIFAFEPSPREAKTLVLHVGLNRCKNVTVERDALGSEEAEGGLHVVRGSQTGCNSLRPPAEDAGATRTIPVHVVRLDDWLERQGLSSVDFIKLDVEGGEMGVLLGAERLLRQGHRPVILAEVQDVRTAPWGYAAKEILLHLDARDYRWFSISSDGSVHTLELGTSRFDGNFVACPRESIGLLEEVGLSG
jgi:FkbM family methyltransferase